MPFPAAPREPIPSWHNLIPSPKGPQTHPWLQNPTASQFPLLPLKPRSSQCSAPPKVFWRPQTTTGPRCPAPPGTVPLSTPMAQSPGTGTHAPSCPMGMGPEGSPLGVRCGNRAVSSFAGAGRGAERRKVTAAAPRSCLGKGGEKSCWRDAPEGNHFLPPWEISTSSPSSHCLGSPPPGQPCRQLPPRGGIIPAGPKTSPFISDPLITLQVGSWAERGHALLHPPKAPNAFMGRADSRAPTKAMFTCVSVSNKTWMTTCGRFPVQTRMGSDHSIFG